MRLKKRDMIRLCKGDLIDDVVCEYQCNGAMAGAKVYKKAPIMIANDVVEKLQNSERLDEVTAVNPGFINIRVKKTFAADYLNQMGADGELGVTKTEDPKMIVVDYGGPNVAKPLHVGHLRSAIIGESIKRIARKMGHTVLGDIDLGDWGYQMGLIIPNWKAQTRTALLTKRLKENIQRRLHLPLEN